MALRIPGSASLLLLGLLIAAGCSNRSNDLAGARMGTVHVHLTDAAGDFTAVNVTLTSLQAHHAGDAPNAWETLRSAPMSVDLLTLAGNLAEFARTPVPAGDYDQLKLEIAPGATVSVNGQTQPLRVPSGSVRIDVPFTVSSGGSVEMLMDFDVASSMHLTGNGTWVLSPVIHVSETRHVGTIAGHITNANADTRVWLGEQRMTLVSSTGDFRFFGVAPGVYTVIAKSPGMVDFVRTGVIVRAGQTTTIESITLAPQTAGSPSGGGGGGGSDPQRGDDGSGDPTSAPPTH